MRKKHRLVYGVGTNDVEYPITKNEVVDGKAVQVWMCPFYSIWKSMLARVYGKTIKIKQPKYALTSVCDDWLTFSNFRAWMQTQDWEGKELDKDIITRGNKVYSPDQCCFVTQLINLFVLERDASRGAYPIGASWCSRESKFGSQCKNPITGKKDWLGYFDNPEEAHQAWLKRKLQFSIILAEGIEDERISTALVQRYINFSGESEND